MRKTITWILVADGTRARIFRNEGPFKGLQPALDRAFEASAPPTRALGTDRPGRVRESANSERHAMVPRVDWHPRARKLVTAELDRDLTHVTISELPDHLYKLLPL
jgi:protein required for attachment to host cells